jgi:hypothetical protein
MTTTMQSTARSSSVRRFRGSHACALTALALASLGLVALGLGGCASSGGGTRVGPGEQVFTLLNDSTARVEVELPSLPGQPTVVVESGGLTTTSINEATDLVDQRLEVIVVPLDAQGVPGRPLRAFLDTRPYTMRVFGSASVLRWSPVAPPPMNRSNALTAPPPPNPGSALQGTR